MRRFALFLLLATAAAPALAAQDGDRGGRHQRGQSTEQTEGRAQRGGGTRQSEGGQVRVARTPRAERSQSGDQGLMDRMRDFSRQQREERAQSAAAADGNEPARHWRRGNRDHAAGDSGSGLRPRERHIRTLPDSQPATATQGSGGIARGFEGRQRRDYRDGNYTRWSGTHWRNDHRYDWRRHRDRHRSTFRLGFYYDPFGWNYRRWSVGSYLYPSYYGSRYWLNDPWHYRLPPAYGPYRWVRYWDDALLVNIYTGTVVDMVHNFFW